MQAWPAGSPPAAEPVFCEICGHRLRSAESRRRRRGLVCDEKVNPNPGRDHSPRYRIPAGRTPGRQQQPGSDQPTLLDELEVEP